MNIVIIDDNEVNVKVLSHIVRRSTLEQAVTFQDPVQALNWCRTCQPDLVLVDYMMPGMDGIEFISHFRREPALREVPLVMVTANAERSIRYRALEMGANDFLTKPVDKTELVARVRNMLTIRQGQKMKADHAGWLEAEIRRATKDILEKEREVIFRLSRTAEYRSPETGLHVMRVALYCRELARASGLPEEDQETIFVASSLHDIGKVGTPDHILYKSDRLDKYEYALMKLHTLTGFEIMQDSTSKIMQMAADIALGHHEKYDGTGYPKGLRGDRIPLAARICSIADVFDALTSERPYKKAWPISDALHELDAQSGRHFDPALVMNFKTILPEVTRIRTQYTERPLADVA